MKYVHKTYIQKHTFLKGGEQRELFDEARLDEGRFDADGGNNGGEHEEVVAELSVVVTVALRQLLHERVAKLAANTTTTFSLLEVFTRFCRDNNFTRCTQSC